MNGIVTAIARSSEGAARQMESVMSHPPCHSQSFAASARDSRADGGVRMVRFSQRGVHIERLVAGVKMHLVVPIQTYEGVLLSCGDHVDPCLYQVSLIHRDEELSIPLHEAIDSPFILTIWRSWAKYFSKPALYRDPANAGQTERHNNIARPRPRRRGPRLSDRRPRFLKRRRCARINMVSHAGPKSLAQD